MGGGGGPFSGRSPQKITKLVKESVVDAEVRAFETSLSGLLNDVLSSANSRDAELVTERLTEIKSALNGPLEGTINTLYGGSVAKHTYVDGLSDIDSLVNLPFRWLSFAFMRLAQVSPSVLAKALRSVSRSTEIGTASPCCL